MRGITILTAFAFTLTVSRADLIECDNGDRYNGKVLSMDEKTVKLQNDITGILTIPRQRIVGISFRPAQPATAKRTTNSPALAPGKKPEFDAAAVDRIQNELLATATPEANQMFQE